ncbi:MAG: hypothetical protein ACKOYM_08395 [Actinomycetes bacterium]
MDAERTSPLDPGTSTRAPGWLVVDFCGEEYDLGTSGRLTFGRSADLSLDDDPYLHRVVGEFIAADGYWWLRNLTDRTTISVRERTVAHQSAIGPGGAAALLDGEHIVGCSSGPHRYELDIVVEAPVPADVPEEPVDPLAEQTLEWGRVDLNDEQRLLLVALAAPKLRDPSAAEWVIPTNRSAAAVLGWTITKLNRKLDHLCVKFARAGVSGLHGDVARLAADRRRRLVEHVVGVGLITAADLDLLV